MNAFGIEIFKFNDARDCLASVFLAKKSRNPHFNLSLWAKQLGLKSQGYLSNVLNGHRPISSALTARFSSYLELNAAEQSYFALLVDYSQERNALKKQSYAGLLQKLNPDFQFACFDLDQFKFIHDWHHIAVSEMIKLKGFKEKGEYLSKCLGGRVSAEACEDSLELLKRLKFVKYDENGRLASNREDPLFIGNDLPNESLRHHHRQFIDLAKDALDQEDVTKRDVRGTTFAIKESNLPQLQKLIKEFHQSLHRLAEQEGADQVIRVNTQAFRMTK